MQKAATSSTELLRVHTDSTGIVWYGRNEVAAVCSHQSPEFFASQSLLRRARCVRVLGVPANAELLTRIHETQATSKCFSRVQVGSPRVCLPQSRLTDPAFVLGQMWQPCVQAMGAGYWHDLTDKDYTTYLLAAAIQRDGLRAGSLALRILPYHPAWPAISFIPTASLEASCLLLYEIMDPRWYLHPTRGGRCTKLWSHLGLSPKNFVYSDVPTGRHFPRAKVTTAAWLDGQSPADLDDPRNFLSRILRRAGAREKPRGSETLAATKRFVQFLSLVWLQSVAASGRKIFEPEMFFKQAQEVQAYRKHLRSLSKPV